MGSYSRCTRQQAEEIDAATSIKTFKHHIKPSNLLLLSLFSVEPLAPNVHGAKARTHSTESVLFLNLIRSVSAVTTGSCRAGHLSPENETHHKSGRPRTSAQAEQAEANWPYFFLFLITSRHLLKPLHFVHIRGRALQQPSEVAHGMLRGAILEG